MSTDHHCRKCNCLLTLDNIAPSQIKKHNWVCKSCDNKRRSNYKQQVVDYPAEQLLSEIKPSQPDYDPADVAFKRVSISNHQHNIQPSTSPIKRCQLCEAFDIQTRTCHYNPPPFPRVYADDWCTQFIAIQ